MPNGYSNEDRMSADDEKSIIENDDLPEMDAEVEADAKLREAKGERMAAMEELVDEEPATAAKGEGTFMEPFKPPREPEPERDELPDVEDEFPLHDDLVTPPPLDDQDKDEAEEGYVRLRLHVENGEIKVIGAREVEGPLLREEAIHGELAYEVRLGKQRLALSALPDTGEIRSFPPPQPTAEIKGHHIVKTRDFDFTIRIPRQYFTRERFQDLEIDVFRIQGELDRLRESLEFERDKLRTVAKLRGMPPDALGDNVEEQIEAILGRKSAR